MAASVEELAFELSLDSLYTQRNVLDDVRSRSATLLTASSIVTSFVGGRAIDAVGLDALTAAAMGTFCLTLGPAIYIVTASMEGSFSIDGARRANRPLVRRVLWSLRLGFAALILEVILVLTALALH